MPVVIFNDKDDCQHELLRRHGVTQDPPIVHQVPSTADFYAAVHLGLGWGMVPESQAGAAFAAGTLVRLSADVIDVPLYWQRWRLDSPKLAALTTAVRTAAAGHLRGARGPGQLTQTGRRSERSRALRSGSRTRHCASPLASARP
jgi:LysR family transcriptional regulator (chromosome initiation inhibitor)